MARNAIQFQKGLSEMAFQEKYGTEAHCETVLENMRWPALPGQYHNARYISRLR